MDFSKLKSLLDEQVEWPSSYDFKFVVKTDVKSDVLTHLTDHQVSEKVSRNGTYTSITSRKMLDSSDEVIKIYKKMSTVKGIITL